MFADVVIKSLSGQLSGGDATGGQFAAATNAALGVFSAIRTVAVACGVAGAVCAIVLVAIMISTATNPPERARLKNRIIGIAIACAALSASSALLVAAANIGASW